MRRGSPRSGRGGIRSGQAGEAPDGDPGAGLLPGRGRPHRHAAPGGLRRPGDQGGAGTGGGPPAARIRARGGGRVAAVRRAQPREGEPVRQPAPPPGHGDHGAAVAGDGRRGPQLPPRGDGAAGPRRGAVARALSPDRLRRIHGLRRPGTPEGSGRAGRPGPGAERRDGAERRSRWAGPARGLSGGGLCRGHGAGHRHPRGALWPRADRERSGGRHVPAGGGALLGAAGGHRGPTGPPPLPGRGSRGRHLPGPGRRARGHAHLARGRRRRPVASAGS